MKARKDPTIKQMMRRLRRPLESNHDPRIRKDGYWALRYQGYPHSYAIRAFRDEPPVFVDRHRQSAEELAGCDPDDLLFDPGSTYTEIIIAMRPPLTEDSISALEPRASEYTVWDQTIRGFGVRVRPSGYKSYVVYYRDLKLAKLHKHTIGKVESFSLEQARRAARNCLQAAQDKAEFA